MIQGKWLALEVKNANYCLQKTTPPQKKNPALGFKLSDTEF